MTVAQRWRMWRDERAARAERRWSEANQCPCGGVHDWQEFAGMGAAGFEDGLECMKCHRTK